MAPIGVSITYEVCVDKGTLLKRDVVHSANITMMDLDSLMTAIPNHPITASILYAEDDPLLRHSVLCALQRAGYSVTVAANGKVAWEILWTGDFDLLLSDNLMPQMTGSELVARTRSEGMHLPIIVMSSELSVFENSENHWLNVTILRKPFTLAELRNIVQEALTGTFRFEWSETCERP